MGKTERGAIDLFKPREGKLGCGGGGASPTATAQQHRACEGNTGGALFPRCHLIHTLELRLPM